MDNDRIYYARRAEEQRRAAAAAQNDEVRRRQDIRFRSTDVQGDGNRIRAVGDLTLAGKTHPVEFDLDIGDDGALREALGHGQHALPIEPAVAHGRFLIHGEHSGRRGNEHGAVGRDEGHVQVADLQEVAHAAIALEWPEPATCM